MIVLALGAARMSPAVSGVYHDDAIYVATAKSLAEGSGYRLIDLPGVPRQTKYPFGYPLLLSVLWKVSPHFPANLVLLRSFSLGCAACAVAGAYLFLTRFGASSRRARAAACLVAATATSTSYFATQTLSEFPFALVTVAALWTTAELRTRTSTSRGDALAGLAMAVPFLFRTLGGPGLITALWYARSRSRLTLRMAVAAALTAGAWIAWIAVAAALCDAGAPAAPYYSAANYLDWWLESSWRVPAWNAITIAYGTVQLGTGLLTTAIPWPIPVTLGVLTWIAIVAACRARDLVATTLVVYGVAVLFWPFPPGRFLLPFLPFLLVYIAHVLSRLSRSWLPRLRTGAAAAIVAAILAGNLYEHVRVIERSRRAGYPLTAVAAGQDARWQDYQRLFAWIAANTRDDDVLGSGLDSMLFMYTGRRAIRPFVVRPAALYYGGPGEPLGSQQEFLDRLTAFNVRYVVELPMPSFAEVGPLSDLIRTARDSGGECLREVFRLESDRRFAVYETNLAACS